MNVLLLSDITEQIALFLFITVNAENDSILSGFSLSPEKCCGQISTRLIVCTFRSPHGRALRTSRQRAWLCYGKVKRRLLPDLESSLHPRPRLHSRTQPNKKF
jgi:hypothetical protein